MKNKKKANSTIMVVLTLVLLITLAACSASSIVTPETQQPISGFQEAPTTDITNVDDLGNTSIDLVKLQSDLAVSGELSEDEITGLLYMREEEKLAHDVYLTLYEKWGLSIFQNIANSEQTHTEAVKSLLDAYGLKDPAASITLGEFVNTDLQALYDELVAQGSQSLGDALKIGAAIEEIDILDLEKHLAQTDDASIRTVYENLMKGSRNHLRSFTSTLDRQTGEIYQPQYLSTDAYQNIVGSGIESGSKGNQNRP